MVSKKEALQILEQELETIEGTGLSNLMAAKILKEAGVKPTTSHVVRTEFFGNVSLKTNPIRYKKEVEVYAKDMNITRRVLQFVTAVLVAGILVAIYMNLNG